MIRIPPIFIDRLNSVGDWLKVDGQAIYGTRPWTGSLPSGCGGGALQLTLLAVPTPHITRICRTNSAVAATSDLCAAVGGKNGCQQGRTGCGSPHVGAVYAITMKYPEPNRAGSRLLTLKTPVSGPATAAQLLLSTGSIALKWQPLAPTGGMAI